MSYDKIFGRKKDLHLIQQALSNTQTVSNYADIMHKDIENKNFLIKKHRMEIYKKFTLSVACLILLFIGAPMGAIIRKGGFGMPILVSVLFYLLFHVLNIIGIKLAENNILTAFI